MALTDNLVSYWKLDESSGNAADSVGTNTLTNNSMTYGAGKINNSGYSNGSAYFSIADNDTFNLSSMSFFCWLKTTSTGTRYVMVKRNNTGFVGWIFSINSGTGGTIQMDIYDSADRYSRSNNISVNDGNRHYIGTTCDSSGSILLYIDGSEVGSYSVKHTAGFTNPNTNGPLHLMTSAPSAAGTITGDIDEVGLWSRVLTSSEITALYNGGSGNQYPFSSSAIKTVNGLAKASIKTVKDLSIASVKTINDLA